MATYNYCGNAGSGGGSSSTDFHSGYNNIKENQLITIEECKQMINFTALTLDGTLSLDGDLWLV